MNTVRRQRGVALLMALLIVALATVTAITITRDQHLNLRRAQNLLHGDQAYLHALGVESWARGVVAKDLRNDVAANLRMDALTESWNAPLPQTDVDGGAVAGQIEDLQSRFNLNNLIATGGSDAGAAQHQLAYLQRLLRRLELDQALAQAIADWLDPDIDTRYPDGAEDLAYMRGEPPYRTANVAMQDTSELLLIHGITPQIYARLAPYVTALPPPTTINVNTAPAPVLLALSDGIDEASLDAALLMRQNQGFATPAAFLNAAGLDADLHATIKESAQSDIEPLHNRAPGPAPTQQIESLIGVASDFFLVHARAQVDRMEIRLDSVIARHGTDGPHVISRTRQPY